jgi:nicotinamide mononucleotide transporter
MSAFIQQLAATTMLEWCAFGLAILQVVLAIRNHVSNFIFGFFRTIIYTYLFYTGGLFAESYLNIYYAIISLLGLYYWRNPSTNTPITISNANSKDWLTAIGITVISFVISYIVLKNFTTSTVPMWDSIVAAFAWSGSWLLTKRKVQNWVLLNCSNAIAIPLLYQKGYVLTSVLTVLLFGMAIIGWWQWHKAAKNYTTLQDN